MPDRLIQSSAYSGEDRRETNGLPLWVRAVAVMGIPGAIALFLVWVGAQEVPRMRAVTDATHEDVLRNREMLREHEEQSAAMYRMLQRICSNTATKDDERQRCFDK